MYDRILVPVDGSAASNLGLDEAIRLAKSQDGAIRLVHVVNELFVVSPDASGANLGDVLDILRQEGESLLQRGETLVRNAGVDVDSVLVEAMGGAAGDYIVKQARDWPADLIVCGTHGRRGIRRIVLGSDAEYIVRQSPVPVLLVRSREARGK